jgi:hypothetical protein
MPTGSRGGFTWSGRSRGYGLAGSGRPGTPQKQRVRTRDELPPETKPSRKPPLAEAPTGERESLEKVITYGELTK